MYNFLQFSYRRLVSPVGNAPVCCAGGSGSIPGLTNTQGLRIIEERCCLNICKWLDFRVFSDKDDKP